MIKAIFWVLKIPIQFSILPFFSLFFFWASEKLVPTFWEGWILKNAQTLAILCNILNGVIRVFLVMTISTFCQMAVVFGLPFIGGKGTKWYPTPLNFYIVCHFEVKEVLKFSHSFKWTVPSTSPQFECSPQAKHLQSSNIDQMFYK